MEIVLKYNYDYDNELGYTQKTLKIEPENISLINGKIIVDLYENDIQELTEE